MKVKSVLVGILCGLSLSSHAQLTFNYTTTEFYKSKTLSFVKADYAYARGSTGKGSIVAVLDSGIDTKNLDFQNGKIKLSKDFTGSGTILDSLGHGTHVAGIAAASSNKYGVEGVAYDATLLIGKITTNGSMPTSAILQGISWASANNADVINLSANFAITPGAIKNIAPGIYTTSYTNTNVIAGGLNPSQWVSALQGNSVIVVAAGNDGTPWSGGITQLATATDSKGNLLLGGRMIIAGNWNTLTNAGTGPSNNGAATLCQVAINNKCQDKFQAWQFYLLAPGTGIVSTVPTSVNSTALATMTGTSMAAPAVSGGVAIIRQMWPQMTGANIAQLLFVTANKSLPGYNPITMGQGLMDLEKATRPYGNVGIPTTGKLSGPSVTSVQPILISGGSASTSRLSNVMLVDSFQRDFYTGGKFLTGYQRTPPLNIVQTSLPYLTKNNYSQFNNYNNYQEVSNGDIKLSLYSDTTNSTVGNNPTMIEVSKPIGENVKFITGAFFENSTWLGNSINGLTSTGNNSNSFTQFAGVEARHKFKDTAVYATLMHGVTSTNSYSESISKIGPIFSYSWTIGAEHLIDNKNSFGITAYQPVSVYKAQADVNVPTGLDNNFNVVQNSKVNLAADVHELRVGLYYKYQNTNKTSALVFAENRQNYSGQTGVSSNVAGIMLKHRF